MKSWLLILVTLFPFSARAADLLDPTRVIRNFDFEERRLGNMEDLPMDWAKVEGDGLPHYVSGHLANDRHRSGEWSFRFDLDGGSLTYRYPAGHIPVQIGAHYDVHGYVQTTPMPNARARLVAYLTDVDDHPIRGTIKQSELFASPPGDTEWHRLSVELSADDAEAKFVVIELQLLQPQLYAPPLLGDRTVYDQDIHGSAWFDDIAVSQVPVVAMLTDRPGNIFRRSEPMQVSVYITDRFTDDLTARLIVTNARGQTVFQDTQAVNIGDAQVLGPCKKRLTLSLPDSLSAGWYQASLEMCSRGQFVGKQTLNLIRLADDAVPILPDQHFGMSATHLPFALWPSLPELLPTLGAGRVKLAVWSDRGDVESGGNSDSISNGGSAANAGAFDALLEEFKGLQIQPTACLVNLPPSVAKKTRGNSWARLLDSDRSLWQPQLASLIARNANHLAQWQLGDDDSDAYVQDPRMRQAYQMVYDEFASLVEKPDLAMPWPAYFELNGNVPSTVAMHLGPQITPSQLPLYVDDVRSSAKQSGAAGNGLSLFLEPLDRNRFGRLVQIRDLAQRFAYATSANVDRIDVRLPIEAQKVADQWMTQPDELLLITRTLMSTLGGATFRGRLPIGDGVNAFLYEKDEQGIIMLWNHAVHRGMNRSDGELKHLALNLGHRPISMDLWGNTTPLLQASAPNPDEDQVGVDVKVGPMPTFLIDVDPYLAQLRSSVAVDDPKLESTFRSHSRHVKFINPYHQAISGMISIKGPPGWTLSPATFSYSLNPGDTFDQTVQIEFPLNSPAGPKTLHAQITVQSDKLDKINVPIALELGLSDVGLQTLALRDGTDIIVQQMISNYGEKPIDYNAFAIFSGQARQERLVTALAPGATIIKKYRFKNVTFTPGAKIRSGIREVEGSRVLNDEVEIR